MSFVVLGSGVDLVSIVVLRGECSFGEYCSFEGECSFGEDYSFRGVQLYCLFEFDKLIVLSGLFDYGIRVYFNTKVKEYYLSIGCMNFATLDEAIKFGKNNDYDLSGAKALRGVINNVLNK